MKKNETGETIGVDEASKMRCDLGEPTSARLDTAEYRSRQEREFFARALDSGALPIIDKDEAESALDDLRRIRGNHHPNVAVFESGVRDGQPILTQIAISKLRATLEELTHVGQPGQQVLVPAETQISGVERVKRASFPRTSTVFTAKR